MLDVRNALEWIVVPEGGWGWGGCFVGTQTDVNSTWRGLSVAAGGGLHNMIDIGLTTPRSMCY